MTTWQMYWLVKLDSIHATLCAAAAFGIIAVIAAIIAFCVTLDDEDTSSPIVGTIGGVVLFVWMLCVGGAVFTPTTKEMCAIVIVPKIINNEKVQNIGENGLSILEEKTAEWLNELKTNEKEDK